MVGNRTVEIRPAESIATEYSSDDDRVIVTSGTTRIVIDGDRLAINDEEYGTVDDGAFILVDDGDVYVDHMRR